MNFIKVLKICGDILGLNYTDEFLYGDKAEIEQDTTAKRLLDCCNSVLDVLYREYALETRQTVIEVKDGFVNTQNLKLIKAVALKDSCGNDVKYRYASGGLYADKDGKYNLKYVHSPDEVTVDGEIELPSPRITERIFVYGVLAEYFSQIGDVTQADIWTEKYSSALKVLELSSVCRVMPARRWL